MRCRVASLLPMPLKGDDVNVRRILVTIVAAVQPLLGSVPAAHAAHADAVVLQGAGTYAPPLGVLSEAHALSFSGVATVTGTDGVAVTFDCQFYGTSFESLSGGEGAMAGSCGPLAFPSCVYARAGVAGTITCAGVVEEMVLSFFWRPVDVIPTSAYTLIGTGQATTDSP